MAGRPRSRVVIWSLLLHGTAIAVLWGVLAGEPEYLEVDDEPVIAIDLVALARSAPPAPGPVSPPSTVPPAKPQPAALEPPAVPQPQRPAPPPRAEPTPRAEPRPAPAPEPAADAGPEAPEPPAPASQPAQASPQPSGGGAAASQQTANRSAAVRASYAQLVLSRLQRAIVYPRRAQRREIEGVVTVEMVIAANGALRTVRLLETSGSTVLDDAALALVRRVAPFPAVPRDLSPDGQDIAFKAPIQYRLN